MVLDAFYSSLYCIVKLAQKALCNYHATPWCSGPDALTKLCQVEALFWLVLSAMTPHRQCRYQCKMRKYWWCLVFIFRVNLLLILCLREEGVSHAKTNECENPHGMIGSLHLHIIAWWLNIPFPYKTHILFSKYTASSFFTSSLDLCFAMV